MLTYKINNRDLKYEDVLLSKDDGMGGKNISFISGDFTRDLITVRTNAYHGLEDDDTITFTLDDNNGTQLLSLGKPCMINDSNEFVIMPFHDYEIYPDYFTELDDFNLPYSYAQETPIEERRKGILFGCNEDYLHYFYRLDEYSPDDYISSKNGRVCQVNNVVYDDNTKTVKFNEERTTINDKGEEERYETTIEEYLVSKFIGGGTFSSLSFNKKNLTVTINYLEGDIPKIVNIDVVNVIDEKKRCAGDIVMCDYSFLFKVNNVENNKYDFSSIELLNTVHDIFFLNEYGDEIVLRDCIVPLMEYGENDKMSLIWGYDPNNDDDVEIAEYIKGNFNNITFQVRNDSFLERVDGEIRLRKTANVYKTVGDMSVNIPISDTSDINLQQQNIFNDFLLDEIAEQHTNKIVDMEKQVFVPVFRYKKKDDNKTYYGDVRKLIFNTKLKQRGDLPNDIDYTIQAWKDNYVLDTWVSNDDMPKNDVLGYWGFTDDDVKYQKNALKKSFIRLSFYDTNKRSTQSLLYYSTLFIDSGRLYGKYMKNINNGVKGSVVHNTKTVNNEDLTLNGSLFVVDNTDATQSSEGFYLYLFPSLCKGNTPTTIYMKAEFNHAKFGATIPLIKTLRKDGNKKLGYIQPKGDISKMNELFNDIYMSIEIRYNDIENRYEWIVGEGAENENGEFSFNFYEPVINVSNEIDISSESIELPPSINGGSDDDIVGGSANECENEFDCIGDDPDDCWHDKNPSSKPENPVEPDICPCETYNDNNDDCSCRVDENDDGIIDCNCEYNVPEWCICQTDANDDGIIDDDCWGGEKDNTIPDCDCETNVPGCDSQFDANDDGIPDCECESNVPTYPDTCDCETDYDEDGEPDIIYEVDDNVIKYKTNDNKSIEFIGDEVTNGTIFANIWNSDEEVYELVFNETVREIKSEAFVNLNTLTHVYLPSTVEKIGTQAFVNCKNLLVIYCEDGPIYSDKPGDMVPSNVIGYKTNDGKIEFSNKVTNANIISNDWNEDAEMYHLTFDNVVTEIKSEAFVNLSTLTHVYLPSTVEKIGTQAFVNCNNLKEIYK